jgi:starch synthase
VFTIHNLAYQGLVLAHLYPELGLPGRFFSVEGLEFHGQAGFMKAGLYYADKLTTVSPTYAREIQDEAQGMGLQGLLRTRAADLVGILNGVDYDIWNPKTDPHLDSAYHVRHMAPKAINKAALQDELGLAQRADAPLACVVSRLTQQKGLDLVLDALPALTAQGGQLALLGAGDAALEEAFQAAAKHYPDQVAVRIGYDEALSHRLIGSADLILVPSRSEPCGLTQLYGLRYGTLPLVAAVGGLADTVIDTQPATLAAGTATGFVCERATAGDFAAALARALDCYRRPRDWTRIRRRAMTRDFSWDQSARQYADLYHNVRRQNACDKPGSV